MAETLFRIRQLLVWAPFCVVLFLCDVICDFMSPIIQLYGVRLIRQLTLN